MLGIKKDVHMSDQQTTITDATGAPVEATKQVEVGQALEEILSAAGAEGAAPEAPVEEPKKEEAPKEQDKFAAKFAALSRKEKQLRAREQEMNTRLKDMEAKLAAKEAEVSSKFIDPARFKKEPLKVMEETGLSFQQLAEMVMNDGKPTQDQALSEVEARMQAKLKEYEDKLAAKEAKEAKERHEAQLHAFKVQLTDFVNTTEDYELIRAEDATSLVYDVIEAHYNKTADESGQNGEILSNKEAADAVEAYLLENAKKLTQVKKLQPAAAPAKPAEKKAATTLSNAQAAQGATMSAKRLSDEESKAEASKLIKWNE